MSASLDRLTQLLSRLGISCARYFEEEVDEQYKALRAISETMENTDFIKAVILNSLSSYQLSCRAERWWWEFAQRMPELASSDLLSAYISFLRTSSCNRRLIPQKVARVEKAWKFLRALGLQQLESYYADMESFRDHLAEVMRAPVTAKTIVFSVKMLGYASRIAFEKFIPYPMSIDIPVDVRIRKLTIMLLGRTLRDDEVIKVWREVSMRSGIPPLHLDSILWTLMGTKGSFDKLKCEDASELAELVANMLKRRDSR